MGGRVRLDAHARAGERGNEERRGGERREKRREKRFGELPATGKALNGLTQRAALEFCVRLLLV
jgi:hypothetical protein